jgi:hypothetical protein
MERKEIVVDRLESKNWVEWFKVLRTRPAGLKDQKWSKLYHIIGSQFKSSNFYNKYYI